MHFLLIKRNLCVCGGDIALPIKAFLLINDRAPTKDISLVYAKFITAKISRESLIYIYCHLSFVISDHNGKQCRFSLLVLVS